MLGEVRQGGDDVGHDKDRVDTSHSVCKFHGIGLFADFRKDFEGSDIFFREFFRRSCGTDEFGFDKDFLSVSKLRRRTSSSVGRALVLGLSLGDVLLQF